MLTNYNLSRTCDLCGELQHRINILVDLIVHDDRGPYPKESGAIRRTSMELTRALADLRRSHSLERKPK